MGRNVKRTAATILALGVVVLGTIVRVPMAEGTSMAPWSFVQKIRRSQLVVIGAVAEVRPTGLLVSVNKVGKGTPPGNLIEVELSGAYRPEFVHYKIGDEVLVFGNKAGPRYRVFVNDRGSLKLESGSPNDYEAAIKRLIEYDVATSTKQKRVLLHEMLRGSNSPLQHAALWELVYLDPNTRNNGFANDDLLPALERLAKGSDIRIIDLAVQIIHKSHGQKSIPILIDLMASGNAASAEAASRVLNSIARRVSGRAPQKYADDSKLTVSEITEWWEKNKSRYQ